MTPSGAAKTALRSVAARWLTLHDEIHELDKALKHILDTIAAPLLARHGVGYETASNGERPKGSQNAKSNATNNEPKIAA
jgi:hypothetical protein